MYLYAYMPQVRKVFLGCKIIITPLAFITNYA